MEMSSFDDDGHIGHDNHDSESSRLLQSSPARQPSTPTLVYSDPEPSSPEPEAPTKPPSPLRLHLTTLARKDIALVFLISILLVFTSSLLSIPAVRLLEMALCRDYYRSHGDPSAIGPPPLSYVDESLCKLDAIQVDLAYLLTISSLISSVLGMVLTIPYGRLASRVGRRRLLMLGLVGEVGAYVWVVAVCYFHEIFPTKLILVSPLFILIGGGSRVIGATVNMVVADVASNKNINTASTGGVACSFVVGSDSEERNGTMSDNELSTGGSSNTKNSPSTSIFYLLGATGLSCSLVSVPLGSYLLSIDLWLPYKVNAAVLLVLFVIMVIGMPESAPSPYHYHRQRPVHKPEPCRTQPQSPVLTALRSLCAIILGQHQQKQVSMLLGLVFLTVFTNSSGGLLFQYASKALDWPLSTIGYISSIRSLVSLLILLFLAVVGMITTTTPNKPFNPITTSTYPRLLKHLSKRLQFLQQQSFISSDISIVRLSFIILGVGTLFTAVGNRALFVTGLVLSAVGGGLGPALQGLLASVATTTSSIDARETPTVVDEESGPGATTQRRHGHGTETGLTPAGGDTTAEVFSSAALFELLAEMVGGFVFAGLFDIGTRGVVGVGIGLPFYVCAILMFVGAVLSFFVGTSA